MSTSYEAAGTTEGKERSPKGYGDSCFRIAWDSGEDPPDCRVKRGVLS